MTSARAQIAKERTSAEGCRHHWLIDEPAGPQSGACCKLCGQRRMFSNVFEDVIRQPEQPSENAAAK
jgi:hypothetical protein